MKLTRLYFDGYKNLSQCEYKFKEMNVLIGANNIGKSNFLEIFSFLNILFRGSEDEKIKLIGNGIGINGAITNKVPTEIRLEIEFEDTIDEVEYSYYYTMLIAMHTLKGMTSSMKSGIEEERFEYKKIGQPGKRKTIFSRNKEGSVKEAGIQLNPMNSIIGVSDKLETIRKTLDIAVVKGIGDLLLISQTPVLYGSPDAIRETFKEKSQLIKNGRLVALNLEYEIEQLLQDEEKGERFRLILEDVLGVKDIVPLMLGDMLVAIVLKFHESAVSIAQLSDGTLMIINLIVYLMTRQYPIIAVEELENSIHPKLLEKVIQLITTTFSDIQILITTHSPILLQCVSKQNVSAMRSNKKGLASIINITEDKKLREILDNPFVEMQDILNEVGEEDGQEE